MNKKYLFFVGLTIVMAGLFFLKGDKLLFFNFDVSPVVVTFNEEGFFPNDITISQGQSVTFQTGTDKQFWPASDSHPSHRIYSEFDPLQPIDKHKSWTFVFDKVGAWHYHDHLYPSYTGKINVLAEDENSISSDFKDCDLNKSSSTEECWNYLIKKGWEDNGSTGALKVLAYLYDNIGDNFPEGFDGCHRDTHRIGELAVDEYYKDLKNYPKWTFPPEAFYCGYGYFHGVLEHLFRKINDTNLAVDICESISENFSDEFSSIRKHCFHGIGHGFMPEIPALEDWGNPLAIVKNPLTRCPGISIEKGEVDECYEGIFNVLADWMGFKSFGLTNNLEDPLFVCVAQVNDDHQKACYKEFGSRLPGYLRDKSLIVVAQYIEHIEDDHIATTIIGGSAAGQVDNNPSLDKVISTALTCREIAPRLQLECFKGVVGGLMAHGIPSKEYVKTVDFCEAEVLSIDERKVCYNHLLLKINDMYNGGKREEACEYIKAEDSKRECLQSSP